MPEDTVARIRALTRDEKLALFAAGVTATRESRARSVANRPTDGSRIVRVRLPTGRILAYRLSADDLAL